MNINYIGFIKKYDININTAKNLSEMLLEEKADVKIKNAIINYLSTGIFLCGALSYIYDDDGNPIGNLDYYTDGNFIWPAYYLYYLKKYENFEINKNLIEYAAKNNFLINELSKNELIDLENQFLREWTKKSR